MTELTNAWSAWRAVAENAARAAGHLIRRKLAEPLQVSSKGFRDLVTDADLAAQQQITTTLRTHFPDHGFLAEEKNSALPTAGPVRWIIDPIDGTSNYSRLLPIFCVSLAVAVAEEVVVGVIYDPLRDELFSAGRGQGATVNGQPLRVSTTADLAEALVGIDWGRQESIRQRSLDALNRFAHHVRSIRALGSSALALAWVAAGRMDLYGNYKLSAWDIAAGALLIHEAGGLTSDLQAAPLRLVENTPCVASNGRLHREFLALL
jgi:myo-inositol-1(or 4)-monophosphatase